MTNTTKSRDFAVAKHDDQMYGRYPYVKHLDDVWGILQEYGHTHDVYRDSAYLHDVLEDCCDTPQERLDLGREIATAFGPQVLEIVLFCTDDSEGRNRKERKANTYQRWREQLSGGDSRLLIPCARVKLADRLANLRSCVAEGSNLLGMYRKEAAGFREALWFEDPCTADMWAEYDNLLKEP